MNWTEAMEALLAGKDVWRVKGGFPVLRVKKTAPVIQVSPAGKFIAIGWLQRANVVVHHHTPNSKILGRQYLFSDEDVEATDWWTP